MYKIRDVIDLFDGQQKELFQLENGQLVVRNPRTHSAHRYDNNRYDNNRYDNNRYDNNRYVDIQEAPRQTGPAPAPMVMPPPPTHRMTPAQTMATEIEALHRRYGSTRLVVGGQRTGEGIQGYDAEEYADAAKRNQPNDVSINIDPSANPHLVGDVADRRSMAIFPSNCFSVVEFQDVPLECFSSTGDSNARQASEQQSQDIVREGRAYYRVERSGRNTWREICRILRRGGEVQLDTANPPQSVLHDLLSDIKANNLELTRISCTPTTRGVLHETLRALGLPSPEIEDQPTGFYLEAKLR